MFHVVHEGLAAERTSPGRAQPRPDLGAERRMQVDRVGLRKSLFSLLSSLPFSFISTNRCKNAATYVAKGSALA